MPEDPKTTTMYRLPYSSPLSNPDHLPEDLTLTACGITKLLQCRWLGPSFCSVEEAIEKLAREKVSSKAVQLKYQALRAVKSADEVSRESWICVLCNWGVTTSSSETDVGDLVFCHSSCRRWLVLETGVLDDDALGLKSLRMGNLLFGMLTFLGIQPEFVRASTFCPQNRLHHRLLDRSKLNSQTRAAWKHDGMPWSEIDFSSFEQGLSLSTMEKIEQQILSIDSGVNEMVKRDRTANGYHSLDILKIKCIGVFEVGVAGSEAPSALLLSHLKKAVSKVVSSAQPQLDPEGKQESASIQPLVCSCCRKTASELGLNSLLRCSRCKASFYCGRACQSDDWRDHKSICIDRLENEYE